MALAQKDTAMLARFLAVGFAYASAAAAQVQPAPPPPIVSVVQPSEPTERRIVVWKTGPIRCAEGAVASAGLLVPMPTPLIRVAAGESGVTLSFDIDPDGRPYAITGKIDQATRFAASDLMPSLRASRLGVSGARRGCTLTYTPEVRSLADASLETIARFGVARRARIEKASWDRFASGNCRDSRSPALLLQAFPDWRKLEARPGDWGWTYVRYDIDAEGLPVNVATVLGSGDPKIDSAGVEAIAATRFAGGPRRGCVYAWWRGPEVVPAPPVAPAKGNPACDIADRWERAPRLVYPPSYQGRAVEGWAVLRFDVAPWGEIGAIEVMEAQPTAEFGPAAQAVLQAARFKPIETGLKGCVDRVIFRISRDGDDPLDRNAGARAD